jgi:NAD(P)-dependent dehydrogenase (short-subunit alcohol dehydrogenase family)
MVQTLENQTVVVLGGSSGIGYGVAKQLLEVTKAKVIIGSSNVKKVDAAVTALSKIEGAEGRISGQAVNLDISTSEDSIAEFFKSVGAFDHLVYTAGDALPITPISEISKANSDKGFGIRYWSLLASIRLALPYLPKTPDASITVTSGNVIYKPHKGWGTAAGVGAAIDGITRGLAVDLAPIRVNCVAPGVVPGTDLWASVPEEQMTAMVEEWKKKLLTGRAGRVEDVAEGYLYLIRGGFTTGQTITMDGGDVLGS